MRLGGIRKATHHRLPLHFDDHLMGAYLMTKKSKLVHGIGVNDAKSIVTKYEIINGIKKQTWICPFYKTWKSMIARCYSKKYQDLRSTYSACTVVSDWHFFSVFREWMIGQPWEGNQLDKDILQPGNKIYGPNTCVFVSSQLNSFLTDHGASRGEWPIGVHWRSDRKKFMSQCRNHISGKQETIGYFDAPEHAHEAWLLRKKKMSAMHADMQLDKRVADAIRNRYGLKI